MIPVPIEVALAIAKGIAELVQLGIVASAERAEAEDVLIRKLRETPSAKEIEDYRAARDRMGFDEASPASDEPTPADEPQPVTDQSGSVQTFAEALLAAALADLALGVREQGGHNRGPQVDAWLRAMGIEPPANWCAVAIGKWIRDAETATGTKCAIKGSPGAQATMVQLQATGRWYQGAEARKMFRPGCIVVWHRGAPGAWTGHIGIGKSSDGLTMHTVEGNSGAVGDRVAEMLRRWDDPLLLGVGLV